VDPISAIAIGTAVVLAINVGGNNSAAEMGPAFGSGIRSKLEAVILIAVFSMIGAVVAGEHVVHTIGSGLMRQETLRQNFHSVIIILLAATLLIGFANILQIPVATSHAMVGAVTGMGLFYGWVNWPNLLRIVCWWLATPLAALVMSYLLGRFVYARLHRLVERASGSSGASHYFYRGFVTLSGCYMAFSAGSNSLAKAVGPVVGAGILTTGQAAVIGGLSMALGAFLVGHRLLHTVGKGITVLDPLKATLVELVCGTILVISSHAGVPVSLAETVTCSVIGFGAAHSGILRTTRNQHVRIIYKLWPVCPLVTAGLSFGLAWLARLAFGG
jgi:PiT family inorganic phosphate transporter/sulfate permease